MTREEVDGFIALVGFGTRRSTVIYVITDVNHSTKLKRLPQFAPLIIYYSIINHLNLAYIRKYYLIKTLFLFLSIFK